MSNYEIFTAELPSEQKFRITSNASYNIQEQERDLTVEVPDLAPEVVEDITERVHGVEVLLNQAARDGEI